MFALAWFACRETPPAPPDGCERLPDEPVDDPAVWDVDPDPTYTPVLSEPRWVVPSSVLPVATQVANNNASILVAGDQLFLAWRTAPNHFAHRATEMHVVSSRDGGQSWTFEHTIALGTDVREPQLVRWDGTLSLSFFQSGTDPLAFQPTAIWRSVRCGPGDWTDTLLEDSSRVPWDLKVRGDRLYRTSYNGDYLAPETVMDIHFESSTDGGETFTPVGDDPVFSGGSSEAAFEFAEDGRLWVVTRNQHGDDTGKGAMVCTAPADAPGVWSCPDQSDPQRYDSPELLRHGHELYLLARRDVGGVYAEDDNPLVYSTRPKRTALYHLDRATHAVEHVMDLPSSGDTAFPQVRRTGPHSWLFANYTSPVDQPDLSWLEGQISPDGTAIYLADLVFQPN